MFALVMLQNFFTGIGDRLARDEEGATAVEYGLIVALIAVFIIGALTTMGGDLADIFGRISTELQRVVAN